jgi:hypothetical protein
MQAIFKNTFCIIIIVLVIYLIWLALQPKKTKPLYMKQFPPPLKGNAAANLNTNANEQRSQHSPAVVDRLPLVEENPLILPANEIAQMNYKDVTVKVEKELYTQDAPLFTGGPTNLVPLDINDSAHRRINFY